MALTLRASSKNSVCNLTHSGKVVSCCCCLSLPVLVLIKAFLPPAFPWGFEELFEMHLVHISLGLATLSIYEVV